MIGKNTLTQRFPALLSRNFRLLWIGQIVSVAGSQMQNVAIGWQIYDRTGSEVLLGMIGLARVIPIIVFSLIGGVVADTLERRRIMLITQSVMMLTAVALALLTEAGLATPWAILGLTALTAAAGAFDGPARQSLLPNLVPPQHFTNAVSLSTVVFQTAMIVGPAISGHVIHRWSVATVYWINAVSFLALIGSLLLMRVTEGGRERGPRVGLDSLFEGFRFVRSNRIVLSTMLLDFFATFFASATALLPVFATEVLNVGADGLGYLYSAEAVGSLIAGLIMTLIGDVRRKGRVLLVAVGCYGLATLLYGFSTNYILSLCLLALVGAGDSVSTVLRQTLRQLTTPDHLRGRMTSVNMIFFMGGPQLGNLEAGLVAAAIGAPLSVATGGLAVMVVVGLTAWRFPRLRRYGEEPQSATLPDPGRDQ